MSNRGKLFKAPSPKKRKKRTPRCSSCRRRDGDPGGEGGEAKVHLKLCARCRGVAYCGIKCQKADWREHREVCVRYVDAVDHPPPSPATSTSKNSYATGQRIRQKVVHGVAGGTVGPTPRQREKAPTKHPFFGRQQSRDLDARAALGGPPPAKHAPSTRKQTEQQRQQGEQYAAVPERRRQELRVEAPANDDDSCPSPPTIQRLSYPGGNNRSGRSSRSSNDSATAAPRMRFASHGTGRGVRSRGSTASPPSYPSVETSTRNSAPIPGRRESAPLYPVAVEKRRLTNQASSSSSGRRGPPPPYASVAHRAKAIIDPAETSGRVGSRWSNAAMPAVSLPLRLTSSSSSANLPRDHASLDGGTRSSLPDNSVEQPAGTTTRSPDSTVPKPPVLGKGSPDGISGNSIPGSTAAATSGRDSRAVPIPPAIIEGSSDSDSEDSAEGPTVAMRPPNEHMIPQPQVVVRDSLPVNSAGSGATAAMLREIRALPVRPAVLRGSSHSDSEDSAAGSEAAASRDDHTVPTPAVSTENVLPDDLKTPEDSAAGRPTGVLGMVHSNSKPPVLAKDPVDSRDSDSEDSAAGSILAASRDDHTVPPPAVLAKTVLPDDDDTPQDSAAGSPVLNTVHTNSKQPVDAGESQDSDSEDSAAGSVSAASRDDHTVLTPAVSAKEVDEDDCGQQQDSAAGLTTVWRDASTAGAQTAGPTSVLRDLTDHTAPIWPVLAEDPSDAASEDSAAVSVMPRDDHEVPTQMDLSKDSPNSLSHDSAAGSLVGPEDHAAVSEWPIVPNGVSDEVSQDSAAGSTVSPADHDVETSKFPAKGLRDGSSNHCKAGSQALVWGKVADLTALVVGNGSGQALSQDASIGSPQQQCQENSSVQAQPAAAHSAAAAVPESDAATPTVPVQYSMDPPPPILPSSAIANAVASVFSRNSSAGEGVFDSCPSSDRINVSGSDRSLSVGVAPQFHSTPLTLSSKGRNGGRRGSPRPRPPLSPGPAALSQSVSQRPRKMSAADLEDKGSSKTTPPASSMATFRNSRKTFASPPSRTASFRSASSESGRASCRSEMIHPRSPPFVPAIELSPQVKVSTSPNTPGPRPTKTAVYYRERSGALPPAGEIGLPPSSVTYLGRPEGFSVHVLVASARSAADLSLLLKGSTGVPGVDDGFPHIYYSLDDRGRVAAALNPGDVVLLTPGRYEARAWGLHRLVSSVEIIGAAGNAGDCVLYNNPAAGPSCPADEHYLVGVMGSAVGKGGEGGASVPEVKGKDDVDDDSDSGFEDGAVGGGASSISSFAVRPVRVRLANLTLEQGSGYRGAVYQLGRESHLEVDGCTVLCSQGGVNVDQGTCVICDSTISGSQSFGLHIGGEGTVEHCLIRSCGQGGEGRRGLGRTAEELLSTAGVTDLEDDGTDVNRIRGMPAISILQSSRVKVRFNVIRDNAGHPLQCRDAPLPGGDGKYAMLARRAEAEAEERLRSWLGSAAVLLREHLQEQHREGSVVSEGNYCQRNKGWDSMNCGGADGDGRAEKGGTVAASDPAAGTGAAEKGARESGNSDAEAHAHVDKDEAPETPAVPTTTEEVSITAGGSQVKINGCKPSSSKGGGGVSTVGKCQQVCVPTGEDEGIPLPAAMTLRFLAAMDEGYVGSRREENARLRRRMKKQRAA